MPHRPFIQPTVPTLTRVMIRAQTPRDGGSTRRATRTCQQAREPLRHSSDAVSGSAVELSWVVVVDSVPVMADLIQDLWIHTGDGCSIRGSGAQPGAASARCDRELLRRVFELAAGLDRGGGPMAI